jgi:hypothetical protein
MGKNCVRCWDGIESWLRCKSCREYVDDEIYWWKERDLEFYFKRHKQNATTRDTKRVRQQTKDFHGWGSIRGTTRHSFLSQRQGEFQI